MKLTHLVFLGILILTLLPVTTFSQDEKNINKLNAKSDYNLNGVFSGAGGKYYFRQLGDEVLWYGEEDAVSPTWSNVAHGIIKENIIKVKWADVPKGEIMQSGNLIISIESNDELVLLEQEGEYFATDAWTRIP